MDNNVYEVITDEQSIKQEGQFLKLTDKCKFQIKSNLIRLTTAFAEETDNKGNKKSFGIAWDDSLTYLGLKKRYEYMYYGFVDGQEGIIRVPAPVFFQMNENEEMLEESKRHFEWSVSVEGQGKTSKYTIVRGKSVTVTEEETKEATAKLLETIKSYVDTLIEKRDEFKAKNSGQLPQ